VFLLIVKLTGRMTDVENQIFKTERDMKVVSGQITKIEKLLVLFPKYFLFLDRK